MAIAAAVNDLFEVRFNMKLEGQVVNNVMHFKCVGASSDVELHLILVLAACFIENVLPVLTSGLTFENVTWKKVAPSLGVEQVTIPPDAGAGGGNAAALPSYASAVISKRTLTGGRSHRGRMYIAGIPEDQTTGSNLNTGGALWAGILAFIACVATNFHHPDPAGGTDLFDFIVYSRKIGGSSFPLGLTGVTDIEQLVPVAALGTTRSRKVGRGS
jgi:hypothetical protein